MPNSDVIRSLFTANCTLIIERDGSISWCDPAAADLLGVKAGSLPGWEFPAICGLFLPDALTPLRLENFALGQILAGELLEDIEICVRSERTGGDPVWLSVTAEPVFSDMADDVTAALVLCRDITERKKALQGLEDTHSALRALVNATPLPILAMEPDGRINFWNRAAENVFGWTEQEVFGKPLPFVPEERKEESRRMRAQDLKGEVLLNRDIRRRRKDGSLLDLTVSTAPILDRKGQLTGTICVYVDVTERKQMEERLLQSAKLESLGILAGGIAHDFNNLLTGILGHTSLAMEDAAPGSEQAEALSAVMTTVDRAVTLTGQLLAYAGRVSLHRERVDLSALIEEFMPLTRSSSGDRIAIKMDLARDLPPVEADKKQLGQVVVNLVLNAREAITHSGTIWLRTGVAAEPDGQGIHCFLEVRDDGCGMDADAQERMFDPFFSTKFTGRGLGLAAVLGIVRGHKGTLRVVSAPQEGSSFVVCLPIAAPQNTMMTG